MINFDNAATTFPKPNSVKSAVISGLTVYGGNPGRSGHKLSMDTAAAIYNERDRIAKFFGAITENVIFTLNCTHALNLAIKGVMQASGHIIISTLEHNAVSRPVHALSKNSEVEYSVARVCVDDDETIRNFEELIQPDTKAIACTLASNVTGQILPYKRIGELCKKHNICFIADGAQACGILPIKLSDGINILCTAGHKGLYGATGTGLMITDGTFEIAPLMEGGTGTSSLDLNQPDIYPEALESGTLNTIGILSLGAGVEFIQKESCKKIYNHENLLCDIFINGLSEDKNFIIYRFLKASYVPIVSFTLKGMPAEALAAVLDGYGFELRGGFHCAALAHYSLGTDLDGTVRFAPSYFNTESQVLLLVNRLKKISQSLK